MAGHFVVQASGAMWDTIEPEAWTYVFGVFVTDQDGNPVPNLPKNSFTVWELTRIGEINVRLVTEVNADFPASSMPGVYRIQTDQALGIAAPDPQEFVFALRVGVRRRGVVKQGMTTVPITCLGKAR